MKKHFLQFNRRQDLRRSLFSLATLLGIAGSGVFVASSGILNEVAFANDLTYQTSVPVEFTFNDYLNVTVSGDLVISDLAPGTFADSNHIAVTVNTNNAYGYTLSATVGDTNNSSRDLRHSGYGTGGNTEVFGNLDLDANLTQETFSTGSTYDNKWGFSTDKSGSAYNGKYNGLPLYSNTEDSVILDTSNYMPTNGTSTTNFWIGAKASSDRVAGTYANVINFMVVGGEAPMGLAESYAAAGKTKQNGYYKIQDMTSGICNAVEVIGSQLQVIDTRDESVYWIAKLADGKCWMVENLDLAGGTALSADDTDVTSAYISSFSTSNNLTKTGNTIVLPASSTSGFNTNNYSYVYNSGNKTNCGASGQNTPCYSYYSWDAATLGSGRTIEQDNTDAEQSICPKGWRLPKSGADTNNGWKRGDFYKLATAYGANLETRNNDYSSATSSNFYNNAGPGTIPGFLLAGYYYYGSFSNGGSHGSYWSSTSYSSTSSARNLRFISSSVDSANSSERNVGFSVRCLASGQ